jgi:hypothetical protein
MRSHTDGERHAACWTARPHTRDHLCLEPGRVSLIVASGVLSSRPSHEIRAARRVVSRVRCGGSTALPLASRLSPTPPTPRPGHRHRGPAPRADDPPTPPGARSIRCAICRPPDEGCVQTMVELLSLDSAALGPLRPPPSHARPQRGATPHTDSSQVAQLYIAHAYLMYMRRPRPGGCHHSIFDVWNGTLQRRQICGNTLTTRSTQEGGT